MGIFISRKTSPHVEERVDRKEEGDPGAIP
jgi:hypothetical protein